MEAMSGRIADKIRKIRKPKIRKIIATGTEMEMETTIEVTNNTDVPKEMDGNLPANVVEATAAVQPPAMMNSIALPIEQITKRTRQSQARKF